MNLNHKPIATKQLTELFRPYRHIFAEDRSPENMPELPDLQVFSKNLRKTLRGSRLSTIVVRNNRRLNVPVKKLRATLEDQVVTDVSREGKEIHFHFRGGDTLGLHMMLRGRLNYISRKNELRFTILEAWFSNGVAIALTDYQGQAMATLNPVIKPSPDALSKALNYRYLKGKLSKSRAAVKNVMLDQDVIRGIGNAYADEILWKARISPFSASNKIPDRAIKDLVKAIRSVLLAAGKSIMKTHPDIVGGEVRDFLKIHNPKESHSPSGGAIKIRKAGSRKTYYTDEQKLFR